MNKNILIILQTTLFIKLDFGSALCIKSEYDEILYFIKIEKTLKITIPIRILETISPKNPQKP